MTSGKARRIASAALVAGLLIALANLAGCSSFFETTERANPESAAAPRRSDVSFEIDAPRIMQGTVASQAVILGLRPVLVRGYGLVIGLDGTGARDAPPELRAYVLGELSRQLSAQSQIEGRVPPLNRLIDSPDTAIVIVEGVVSPGSATGVGFDVRVLADPRTGTTSLEGGTLLPTELRPPNPGENLPNTQGRGGFSLAFADGPIFINPFAESGSTSITGTTGRIMNGGEVARDLPLKLRLSRTSHSLSASIARAINTRFPEEFYPRSQQWLSAAHGQTGEVIDLRVPPSFRDRTKDYLQLVQHTTIRLVNSESVALAIRRMLEQDPSLANPASWRWQALGQQAVPIIRDLYDHKEELVQLAALRAAAGLGDPIAIPHLIELADSGSNEFRREAIRLLGRMPGNPSVDQALRGFLNDPDTEARLAAYEGLADRGDPFMDERVIPGKFTLHVLDSSSPLIYISQFGRPQIAVFGRDLSIDRPVTVHAWNNRFLLRESATPGLVDVFFRPEGRQNAIVDEVNAELADFIPYLARSTTPDSPIPGLDFSYADTVGAVYQIWSQRYLPADFKSEQDRILQAIREFQQEEFGAERPEFSDPDFDDLYPETITGQERPSIAPDFDWDPSTLEALDLIEDR